MRSAHGALYACQEGHNIGHLPTPGNSKTAGAPGRRKWEVHRHGFK